MRSGNSLRFGEDVIAGSVNVETMGVDVVTGDVTYTCTADGCATNDEVLVAPHRLAVMRRRSHVLRAVDAMSGQVRRICIIHAVQQRWNVSVSEHELEMGWGASPCAHQPSPWRVTPPDGLVSHDTHGWTLELHSPIAQVWTWSEEGEICEVRTRPTVHLQ